MKEIILQYGKYVETKERIRSNIDRRVFVDYYIMEYIGTDNEFYRKSFEVRPDEKPILPVSGTHKELNKMKQQWK